MSKLITDYVGTTLVIIAAASFVGEFFATYSEKYVSGFYSKKDLVGIAYVTAGTICIALAPWSQHAIFNFNGVAGLIAAAVASASAFVAGPVLLGHIVFLWGDIIRKKF